MRLSTSLFRTALALGISILTILAFQNCSNVNFEEDQPATFKVSSTATVEEHAPDVGRGKKAPAEEEDVASSSLIECQLVSPNQKIILDKDLKKGSNAAATRVCMSEYACLELINAYAAKRACELTLGPSESHNSQGQCTKIFPGSKGTCRNAAIASDEKVAEILEHMENPQ